MNQMNKWNVNMRRMSVLKSQRWRHGDGLLIGLLGVVGNRGLLLFDFKATVTLKTPDLLTDPLFAEQRYRNDVKVVPVWKDPFGQGYSGKGVQATVRNVRSVANDQSEWRNAA